MPGRVERSVVEESLFLYNKYICVSACLFKDV